MQGRAENFSGDRRGGNEPKHSSPPAAGASENIEPKRSPQVSFTDANNGTVVGEGGTILRTTTGGEP